MKKTTLSLLLLFFTLAIWAQQPAWTNYQAREERFPESMYLVGFVSDENTQNLNQEKFMGQLTDYARVQVIQAIQVEIQSKVTNNMKVLNGEVDQLFQQSSVSLAKAEIAGLAFKQYYDSNSKWGYALAYAKRTDLIAYYKQKLAGKLTAIPLKINEAEQLQNSDDKKNALKSYYECMPLFAQLEEAQALLIALGESSASLQLEQSAAYKTKVKLAISALQNSANLSLGQLCYMLAHGLHLQTGELKNHVFVGDMTFQDTEMTSDFSTRFKTEFKQNLVKAGKYSIQDGDFKQASNQTGFYSNYFVDGTYWEENGRLKVIVWMRDAKSGQTKATAEGAIALDWLAHNQLNHIPSALEKLTVLPNISLHAQTANYQAKITDVAKKPLVAIAHVNDKPTQQIPLRFKLLATNETLAQVWTDAQGQAQAILSHAKPSTQMLVIVAELDLAAYLGLGEHSSYAAKLSKTRALPQAKFFAKISGPTACIQLSERNVYNQAMSVPVIEPKLKEALTEKGYSFTNDPAQADVLISINAKSRKGNNVHGLFFAFVDATVSVLDLASGREIFKQAYNDIKGGSGNWERAALKAYNQAAEQVAQAVPNQITSK